MRSTRRGRLYLRQLIVRKQLAELRASSQVTRMTWLDGELSIFCLGDPKDVRDSQPGQLLAKLGQRVNFYPEVGVRV